MGLGIEKCRAIKNVQFNIEVTSVDGQCLMSECAFLTDVNKPFFLMSYLLGSYSGRMI